MERSESLVELTKALSKFQGEITSVKKTEVNPFFKSKYADLDAVWEMCRKPLSSNGFALVQMPVEIEGKLYLETLLIHTSGEYIKGYLALNPKAIDPQSVGSAITYARRYAMSAMLGVSADEDDDAEKAIARGADQRLSVSDPPREGRVRASPLKADSSSSAITGVCTIPGHNSAKLGKHPTLGWVHKLSNGEFCPGALLEAKLLPSDDGVGLDVPAPASQQGPGGKEFPDTPLGNFQRELAKEGTGWGFFENAVLHMPWPEWVKVGGNIKTATTRWERYKSEEADDNRLRQEAS